MLIEENSDLLVLSNQQTCSLFWQTHQDVILDENKPELKVRLLNQWNSAHICVFAVIYDLLAEEYNVKITNNNDYDLVIDGVFGQEPIVNKEAYKIFYVGESQPAKLKDYDLSLGFDYLSHDHYMRLPLYYLYFKDKINADYQREGECNPNKPHFACFLVGNAKRGDGAVARGQMFHDLSTYKTVTSGGSYLNNIGRIIPTNETIDFFSQCKFTISYENNGIYPGYMTEKLFFSYFSGSVPLYYSHPSVQDEINKDAIISRQDFKSNKEMIDYIIKLDQDDELYCKIWNNSIINDPRRNYQEIKKQVKAKMEAILPSKKNVSVNPSGEVSDKPLSKTGFVMVLPSGGIGNQLFQYAASYVLAKKTESKLLVIADQLLEKKGNNRNNERNFALSSFNIAKEQMLYKHQIPKEFSIFAKINKKKGFNTELLKNETKSKFNIVIVDEDNFFEIAKLKNNQVLVINEFFESEVFFEEFKDEIKGLFTIDNPNMDDLVTQVSQDNAGCLHIRRGDMVANSAVLMSIDFHLNAMEFIKHEIKQPQFYIFSDSIKLTRQELKAFDNITFIENNKPIDDFYLMSKCNYLIATASTFSWWAGYLNQKQNIIAPYPRYSEKYFNVTYKNQDQSYNKRSLYYSNSYPKDWLLLARDPKDDSLIRSSDLKQLKPCAVKFCFNEDNPTIVTSFYQNDNKSYFTKLLQKNLNLIVYTDQKDIAWLNDIRGDLPMVVKLQASQSVVNLVNDAISYNPYNSSFFIWGNASIMQSEAYMSDKFPNVQYMLDEQISLVALNVPQGDRLKLSDMVQAGGIKAWQDYKFAWNDSGNSQDIMSSIYFKYPKLINLIYPDIKYQGDKANYGLRYFSKA